MPATPSLTGQIAVVTGASGGIGRAIAERLAGAGASVVVHGFSNRPSAEATAQALQAKSDATAMLADMASAEARSGFVRETWNWRGRVDVLVNCAGADVLTGDAAGWTFEQKLARLWEVDVVATIDLARQFGRRMQTLDVPHSRAILNIGWDQAEQGMAGDSGEMFAAVKGAVMAFSRSLAQSLAPAVRVNCLCPGWIRTAWGETASDYWQQRAERQALRGRWGTPDDVAATAVFLCSPAADFLTGQVIHVNGGFRYE